MGLQNSKKKKKKKKKNHKHTVLLGFTVIHTRYRFESDCKLIRNILYSYYYIYNANFKKITTMPYHLFHGCSWLFTVVIALKLTVN